MRIVSNLAFILLVLGASCTGQAQKKSDDKPAVTEAEEVTVYYFHNTRRCATCKAVEAQTKKFVQDLYGDEVLFEALSLEAPQGQQKAEALGVSGQTLLIACGETQLNLTNEGFIYARSNPDKLKQIIKGKIDPLVN